MKKYALLLLLGLTLASCGGTKFSILMDSWLGHSSQELIQSWGPPSTTNANGGGGEVLTWTRQVGIRLFHKHMYVNESGKIYYWSSYTTNAPTIRIR